MLQEQCLLDHSHDQLLHNVDQNHAMPYKEPVRLQCMG